MIIAFSYSTEFAETERFSITAGSSESYDLSFDFSSTTVLEILLCDNEDELC